MLKEQIALRAIATVIGAWEKMQVKLESAIDSLREVMLANTARISKTKEDAKRRVNELELKNKALLVNIEQADRFKNNVEKMLS